MGELPFQVIAMLLGAAQTAKDKAYAPYSYFSVGAALLAEDGRVFTGCNVENASYGLTNCAERTAVFKAVSEGTRRFVAIAVVGDCAEPCYPCGACRQVLTEFNPDMYVIAGTTHGDYKIKTARELLPDYFGPDHLKK